MRLADIKGKNILIFDLETTGFPTKKKGFKIGKDEYYDYTDNSKYDSSRIVSVAWVFINNCESKKLNNININEYIRKPIDFDRIDNSNIHNITHQMAKQNGELLSNILNYKGLAYAIKNCDIVVGHNCLFDLFILINECHRLKFNNCINKLKSILDNKKYFCTGEYGRDICKFPMKFNKNYKYKMPTLSELYCHYYKVLPKGIHNAKVDVSLLVDIIKKIIDV
ncbi:DEDDh 3'-5' exonuclease [Catovirus CTV1]|uniref:DEDDh 3'-5' exonuclease n=1 Tax=Catovirus CTV1 TaxID=1977631 RepID=A0A1V0S9V5_9VIRU|nr:DEDDh 3'-5' exonuclease [Catovirus CTV1]